MVHNKKWGIIFGVCAVLIVYAGTDVFAYRGMNRQDQGEKESICAELDGIVAGKDFLQLTETQCRDVQAMNKKIARKIEVYRDIIVQTKQDIALEKTNDTINKKRLHGLIDRLYEAKKAKARYEADAEIQLKTILAPEQWEKAQQHKARFSGQEPGMRNNREKHMPMPKMGDGEKMKGMMSDMCPKAANVPEVQETPQDTPVAAPAEPQPLPAAASPKHH